MCFSLLESFPNASLSLRGPPPPLDACSRAHDIACRFHDFDKAHAVAALAISKHVLFPGAR